MINSPIISAMLVMRTQINTKLPGHAVQIWKVYSLWYCLVVQTSNVDVQEMWPFKKNKFTIWNPWIISLLPFLFHFSISKVTERISNLSFYIFGGIYLQHNLNLMQTLVVPWSTTKADRCCFEQKFGRLPLNICQTCFTCIIDQVFTGIV